MSSSAVTSRSGIIAELAVLLCLALTPPSAAAQTATSAGSGSGEEGRLADVDAANVREVFLALTIRDDLSPYDFTRYELKNRGRTLILSLSKSLLGGYGELQDVALLSFDALPRLVQTLADCGLDQATTETDPLDESTTYRLEVRLDEYSQEQVWTGAVNRPGSPHWCTSRLLIDTYETLGDPIPFVDLFWDEGQYGELSTTSLPPAQLFVDGRDTGLTTPVFGLRLEPGVHMLRYVNEGLGIDREYDATIVEGLTTRINVELR